MISSTRADGQHAGPARSGSAPWARRPQVAAAILAACLAPPAAAETICVGSQAQLVAAFATAAASPEATEIRVRAGQYLLPAPTSSTPSLVYSADSDLVVSGGWTGAGGTCTTRGPHPNTTVLNAGGTGPLMRLFAFSSSGVNIEIRGLSLRSGLTPDPLRAACLEIESDAGSEASFVVEQNTFLDCVRTATSGTPGGAISVRLRDASARIRNNVVTTSFSGTGAVTLNGSGNAIFYASNNTITGNVAIPGRSDPFGLQLGSIGTNTFWVQNNVLWGNGGTDLFVSPGVVLFLTRNMLGTRSPLPAGTIDTANDLGVDPGFAGPGDLRPGPASPMRDRGGAAAGGLGEVDVAGQPRLQGLAVDRGAHEFDELFSNGFE
jgi:hypothetical protein